MAAVWCDPFAADPDDEVGSAALAALMAARPGAPVDLLDTLGALAQRPAWHASAACRGVGAELFFPERGASTDDARALCAVCPVVDECRSAGEGEQGVWGGASAQQRRLIRSSGTMVPDRSDDAA
ncbi:hypothetical protein BH23ACT2_BH23ACT2_18440 [soil metagenome]